MTDCLIRDAYLFGARYFGEPGFRYALPERNEIEVAYPDLQGPGPHGAKRWCAGLVARRR